MHWKFLLFGITGNLAKIKILPGLGEFAFLNQDKLSVELIGYSRSLPNLEQIEKALNLGLCSVLSNENSKAEKENSQASKTSEQNSAKYQLQNSTQNSTQNPTHNLTNITFEQGNYADGKILFENIAKLENDQRLVVYLAVPPSTFLKFLQNACPYGDQNVDFIIEKPFGRDPIEADKLLNLVQNCGLEKQVHFCDHYLFKNSTLLTDYQSTEVQKFFENTDENWQKTKSNTKKEDQHLDKKPISQIQKIHIQILESVDLKGRAGYFDTTGALKDMWPHLFSLLFLTLETGGFETDFEIEVVQVFLGQYESYADEEGLSDSVTETYFWIKLKTGNTEIILESGKNLPNKITQMTLETIKKLEEKNENKVVFDKENSNVRKFLSWSIYPHEEIVLTKITSNAKIKTRVEKMEMQNLENLEDKPEKSEIENIESNQGQNYKKKVIIDLKKTKLDQTNLFELLAFGDKKRFVESEKIKKSWNWWQKVTDFVQKNHIKVEIYPDQTLPITK